MTATKPDAHDGQESSAEEPIEAERIAGNVTGPMLSGDLDSTSSRADATGQVVVHGQGSDSVRLGMIMDGEIDGAQFSTDLLTWLTPRQAEELAADLLDGAQRVRGRQR